jgi:hypothetical protein
MRQSPHSITLNIPYDLPAAGWESLFAIYKTMRGWADGSGRDGCPTWWPEGQLAGPICASVEPSGLLIEGNVSRSTWVQWIAEFQQRATAALGFSVHDAEE